MPDQNSAPQNSSAQPQTQDKPNFWGEYLPDIKNWLLGAGGAALGAKSLGIIPPSVALKIPRTKSFINKSLSPSDREMLIEAIKNTPHAQLSPEGLHLNIRRWQLPSQAGKPANSGGVFYEPKYNFGSQYEDHPWGGPQYLEGKTLLRNPYFVPEDFVEHSGEYLFPNDEWEGIRDEIGNLSNVEENTDINKAHQDINSFRKDYSPDNPNIEKELIYPGSPYIYPWLSEGTVAQRARDLGYDSIVTFGNESPSYEQLQGGKPHLGELMDLRENKYPTPQGGFSLFPQYQQFMK